MIRSLRHRFQADRTHYPSRALCLMGRYQRWSDLPLRSRMRPRYRPVELRSLGGGLSALPVGGQGSCGHHEPAGEYGGQRPAQHAPLRIRLHSCSFSRQEPAPLVPGYPKRCRSVRILTPSLHLAPDRGKDDRKSKGMEGVGNAAFRPTASQRHFCRWRRCRIAGRLRDPVPSAARRPCSRSAPGRCGRGSQVSLCLLF